jgi:hypothetical protein
MAQTGHKEGPVLLGEKAEDEIKKALKMIILKK